MDDIVLFVDNYKTRRLYSSFGEPKLTILQRVLTPVAYIGVYPFHHKNFLSMKILNIGSANVYILLLFLFIIPRFISCCNVRVTLILAFLSLLKRAGTLLTKACKIYICALFTLAALMVNASV